LPRVEIENRRVDRCHDRVAKGEARVVGGILARAGVGEAAAALTSRIATA
jgi:hypothetical protein